MDPSRHRAAAARLRGSEPEPPRIQVTVDERGPYALVAVGGEIDIMTGPQLREPLHDLIGRGVLHHVIDLSDVTFIDSTGLGILVGERRRLRERGGSVRVVCGPGIARRVLHLTAVDRLIDIHDTVEAAVAALGVP